MKTINKIINKVKSLFKRETIIIITDVIPKFKIGEVVTYNYAGMYRTGKITSIKYECDIRDSDRISEKYTYRVKYGDKSWQYNLVRDEDIDNMSVISPDLLSLITQTNEVITGLNEKSKHLKELCNDIMKYPQNNDWRIVILKKSLKNFIIEKEEKTQSDNQIDLVCDCCDEKVIYKETIDHGEETYVRVYCANCELIIDYEMS